MAVRKQNFETRKLVLTAVAVALMTVCSWMSFQIGVIEITLQTFGVFVIAGLLGLQMGTASICIYLLLGLLGLPVFSGFSGGIPSFTPYTETGATGGYLLGFIFTAIIIGLFQMWIQKVSSKWIRFILLFAGMFIGDVICFFFGTAWFVLFNPWGMGMKQAIAVCVAPFIVPDIIKMVVAAIVVERVKKYIRKY